MKWILLVALLVGCVDKKRKECESTHGRWVPIDTPENKYRKRKHQVMICIR